MEESIDREKLDYRPNVCLLVVKDGRILVVYKQKNEGFWYFPGGGVEEEESEKEAAEREFKEELGNSNFEVRFVSDVCFTYEWPEDLCKLRGYRGQKPTIVVIDYFGSEDDISLNEELSNFKFVSPEEIKNYIDKEEFLEKFNEAYEQVF